MLRIRKNLELVVKSARRICWDGVCIFFISIIFSASAAGQVRIRIYSLQSPGSVLFSVVSGSYMLNSYTGINLQLNRYEPVYIAKFYGRLAVKTRSGRSFICDSLSLTGVTGSDLFSVRPNTSVRTRQTYQGNFNCYPDLGTLVMINESDYEKYVAGVVRTEGGSGQSREYLKTQAILARTYMFKYCGKHLTDRYNVCDNTHCQAFNGLCTDSAINRAVRETRGLVILDQDSSLIISAFHSNCGGETAQPENVWLTSLPYLKPVMDPYCLKSRNATWRLSLGREEWIKLMKKSGFAGPMDNPALFTFSQKNREGNYRIGSFSVPLSTIRSELNLRSTFFSVITNGDSVILRGRGYGHGVGLCQEGAMEMAEEGHNYLQIIGFYYSGVIVTDIKNATTRENDTTVVPLPAIFSSD